MKLKKTYFKVISAVLLFIFSFMGCSLESGTNSYKNLPQKDVLTVHYIDVGQADSILVQFNDKNMLIDAGNKEDGNEIASYLKEHGVDKLDIVAATHPHEDHIGGMAYIIKKFPIGKFYAPKKTTTTEVFKDMVSALGRQKIYPAHAGMTFNLSDDVTCEFIAPNSKSYKDTNNYSAAIKLTYKESKFLFMGDAEKLSEKEILDNNFDISADALKVGHHGSSSSTSKEFLNKVSPKIAVISCGKDNQYGHPNKETLSTLKNKKIIIYRTDIDGTIVLTSDGKKVEKE